MRSLGIALLLPLILLTGLVLAGCGDQGTRGDAGTDGRDAGLDDGLDAGLDGGPDADNGDGDTRQRLTVFGFTPKYFDSIDGGWVSQENTDDFFVALESLHAGIYGITGPWYRYTATDTLPPPFDRFENYAGLSERFVATMQFTEPGAGLPVLDPAWGASGTPSWDVWNQNNGWEAFANACRRLAGRYHPPFLAVGIEINEFARNQPAEFQNFAGTVFPDIVGRVQGVSPATVVFPVFQFEWMCGDIVGACDHTGQNCDPKTPNTNSLDARTYPRMFAVLNQFPASALTHVGFTTYPSFNSNFATPALMPDDYYSRLYADLDAAHQGVKVLFVESGWPADSDLDATEACILCKLQNPASTAACTPVVVPDAVCAQDKLPLYVQVYHPWMGSEQEQLDFVQRFAEITAALDPALVTWSFFHDADERSSDASVILFWHLGLVSFDGSITRPAYDAWRLRWLPP